MREADYRASLLKTLRDTKKRHKNPERTLTAIFEGNIRHYNLPHGSGWSRIACIFQEILSGANNKKRSRGFLAFLLDLTHIKGCTMLQDEAIVDGLFSLYAYQNRWIRPLESWKPRSRNRRRQFSHLLRHLLTEYKVPSFMDQAFYFDNSDHIHWFIHIGQGKNIRKASHLPLHLTKKMAHYFLMAPPDFTINEALRMGQILGLGGRMPLVKAILGTFLRGSFENDPFWVSVLQFLINQNDLEKKQIHPLLDYINHQKYVSQEMVLGRGQMETVPPPQPNFSMKGRTLSALNRDVQSWHRELQIRKRRFKHRTWSPVSIPDYEYIISEGTVEQRIYQIRQLLTSDELYLEGKAMHHCVSTYVSDCVEGDCSIWSLTCEDVYYGKRRRVTIELEPDKTICQAKAKYNEDPSGEEMQVMTRWAMKNGLSISRYL